MALENRYIKKYIISSLLIIHSIGTYAQHQISGNIKDTDGEALIGATIVLLDRIDSTMVAFCLSNEKGAYQLTDITATNYILQVTYVSYANYSDSLSLDWEKKHIQLDDIILHKSNIILQEIEIKSEHIPMGLKGDTVSYNAMAFKTRPNATVEDLLKKLPGIEVERDGSIKAHGKNVENVMVDGKTFFGNDPTMATHNIMAEAVDKVEIFDKKSELSTFTGIEDHQDKKTINLKLKEDHKKGGFGDIKIAAGSEQHYDSKSNYFQFTPTLQLSLLFSSNNINKETFSFNDRISFMGGLANALSSNGTSFNSNYGLDNGLNHSLSTGTNLNYDFSSKLEFRSHYIFNRAKNNLHQTAYNRSFTSSFEYDSIDTLDSDKKQLSHQINSKLKYKVNPFSELIFTNNFEWSSIVSKSFRKSYFEKNKLYEGNSLANYTKDNRKSIFKSSIVWRRKYTKKGRNLISKFSYSQQHLIYDHDINNTNIIIGQANIQAQNKTYSNIPRNLITSIKYTEPISNRNYLSATYKYYISQEKPQGKYYDIIDKKSIWNPLLSTQFEHLYHYHHAELLLRLRSKRTKLNLGLSGQISELRTHIVDKNKSINNIYQHLLPSLEIDRKIKGGKNFKTRYLTSILAPSIGQLNPLINIINPNSSFTGDPSLRPAYNHQLSLDFSYYNSFSFTSLFANFSGNYTLHKIVNRTYIDDHLYQIVRPINTDYYYDINAYLHFAQPFRPLSLKYKLSTKIRYAIYDSYLNNQKTNVADNTWTLRLNISNRKTKYIYVNTGIKLNRTHREYGIRKNFHQTFIHTDYYVDTEIYLSKTWTIGNSLEYNKYRSNTYNNTPAVKLWSANISKLFWDNKIEIRLDVIDILNENIGYNQSGNINSKEEKYYTTIGRYTMLGIQYKIGKKKKNNLIIEME